MRAKSMMIIRGVWCRRNVLTGLARLLKHQTSLLTVVIVIGFLVGMPNVGWADTITFDLEDQTVGTFTSITDTQNGLTLTVHREDNGAFNITNLSPNPPAFGNRSIGNFASPFGPGATLVLNFSSPINSGSISFGDFDGDDDSPVTLTAFSGIDGTGTNLGSSSVSYPASLNLSTQGNAAIGTVTVSAAGIESLTISSGGPFPGSLFFDNIVATTAVSAVPEPASIFLLSSGLLMILALRKRMCRPLPRRLKGH